DVSAHVSVPEAPRTETVSPKAREAPGIALPHCEQGVSPTPTGPGAPTVDWKRTAEPELTRLGSYGEPTVPSRFSIPTVYRPPATVSYWNQISPDSYRTVSNVTGSFVPP